MSESLEHHLRTGFLRLLVFDDAAARDAESLLGLVRLPLLALAHSRPIHGAYPISNVSLPSLHLSFPFLTTRELQDAGEQTGGWMDVSLSWLHDYVPPGNARQLQIPEPVRVPGCRSP